MWLLSFCQNEYKPLHEWKKSVGKLISNQQGLTGLCCGYLLDVFRAQYLPPSCHNLQTVLGTMGLCLKKNYEFYHWAQPNVPILFFYFIFILQIINTRGWTTN